MNESNIRRAQNELLKAHFEETAKLRAKVAELEEENRLAWAVVEKFLKKHGNAVVHPDDMNKTEFEIAVEQNLSGEVILRWKSKSKNTRVI